MQLKSGFSKSINATNKNVSRKLVCIMHAKRVSSLSCSDCRYYTEQNGMCGLISKYNHHTDELKTMHAVICREQDELCGANGRYFETSSSSKFFEKLDIDDYCEKEHIVPFKDENDMQRNDTSKDSSKDIPNPEVIYSIDGSSTFVASSSTEINKYYEHIQTDLEESL